MVISIEIGSTPEWLEGFAAARREIERDGWTPEMAREYVDNCARQDAEMGTRLVEGRDEHGRGFMSVVHALAAV